MTKLNCRNEANASMEAIFEASRQHLSILLEMDLEILKDILKNSYKEENSYLKEQFHKDLENIQKMKLIIKENPNAIQELLENPEFKEISEKILLNGSIL